MLPPRSNEKYDERSRTPIPLWPLSLLLFAVPGGLSLKSESGTNFSWVILLQHLHILLSFFLGSNNEDSAPTCFVLGLQLLRMSNIFFAPTTPGCFKVILFAFYLHRPFLSLWLCSSVSHIFSSHIKDNATNVLNRPIMFKPRGHEQSMHEKCYPWTQEFHKWSP